MIWVRRSRLPSNLQNTRLAQKSGYLVTANLRIDRLSPIESPRAIELENLRCIVESESELAFILKERLEMSNTI
jgi:hypothetical protein